MFVLFVYVGVSVSVSVVVIIMQVLVLMLVLVLFVGVGVVVGICVVVEFMSIQKFQYPLICTCDVSLIVRLAHPEMPTITNFVCVCVCVCMFWCSCVFVFASWFACECRLKRSQIIQHHNYYSFEIITGTF
jgi:hypothetical protein